MLSGLFRQGRALLGGRQAPPRVCRKPGALWKCLLGQHSRPQLRPSARGSRGKAERGVPQGPAKMSLDEQLPGQPSRAWRRRRGVPSEGRGLCCLVRLLGSGSLCGRQKGGLCAVLGAPRSCCFPGRPALGWGSPGGERTRAASHATIKIGFQKPDCEPTPGPGAPGSVLCPRPPWICFPGGHPPSSGQRDQLWQDESRARGPQAGPLLRLAQCMGGAERRGAT